jgi:2-polyprenyl-6-methoxyphenol hydroxylase-like FAD-dependent oxidoreductase
MGPSAGAGMMVGVLGAWRLGWRLALAVKGNRGAENLLNDYDREQHAASKEVQNANATIFCNMGVTNQLIGMARNAALRGLSHVKPVVRRMTEKEALVTQKLSIPDAEVLRETYST